MFILREMPRKAETTSREKEFKTSKRSLSTESNHSLCKRSDLNVGCKRSGKYGLRPLKRRKRSFSSGDNKNDSNPNRRIRHSKKDNFEQESASKKKDELKTCAVSKLKVSFFICESCGRNFSKDDIFNKHMFGNCRKEQFYYCKYCRKEYDCRRSAVRHGREHGNITCKICKARLLSTFGLKRHVEKKHARNLTIKSTSVLTTTSSPTQKRVKGVKKAKAGKLNRNSVQIRKVISGTKKSTTKQSNRNSTATKDIKKSNTKIPKKNSVETIDVKKKLPKKKPIKTKVINKSGTKHPKKKSKTKDVKKCKSKTKVFNRNSTSNKKSRTNLPKKISVNVKDGKKPLTKLSNTISINATNIKKLKTKNAIKKSIYMRDVSKKVKEPRTKKSAKYSDKTNMVKLTKKLTRCSKSNSRQTMNLTKLVKKGSARNSNNYSMKMRNLSTKGTKPRTEDYSNKSVKMRNGKKTKKRTDFGTSLRKMSNVATIARQIKKK